MPNWCHNRVEIYSDNEKDLKQIRSIFESQRPLHQIIPEPDWLNTPAEIDIKDGVGNPIAEKGELPTPPEPDERLGTSIFKSTGRADERWYDWRIKNWGIKWDIDEINTDDDSENFISYSFETPWGPPEHICSALREKFKQATITWFFDEPGMELAGYL